MEAPLAFVSGIALLGSGTRHVAGQQLVQSNPCTHDQRIPSQNPRRQNVRAILPFFKKKSENKARGTETAVKPFHFDIGFSFLAHPRKDTGEDAFFVEGNAIGVFDGVSTVSDALDVDPRLYSQTLAALTSDKVKKYGAVNVSRAVIEASSENDQIGASTACVVGMDGPRLFGLNLGDSGVLVVRDGKKIFETKAQSHFFNCPYQLTSMTNAGYNSGDTMQMGQNVQVKVKAGDIVMLATDGLWDNMTVPEIVSRCSEISDPRELADSLADTAMSHQLDTSYRSPFQMAAEKAGKEWVGGKEDDLTLVVGKVVEDPSFTPATLLSTLPEA